MTLLFCLYLTIYFYIQDTVLVRPCLFLFQSCPVQACFIGGVALPLPPCLLKFCSCKTKAEKNLLTQVEQGFSTFTKTVLKNTHAHAHTHVKATLLFCSRISLILSLRESSRENSTMGLWKMANKVIKQYSQKLLYHSSIFEPPLYYWTFIVMLFMGFYCLPREGLQLIFSKSYYLHRTVLLYSLLVCVAPWASQLQLFDGWSILEHFC